MLEEAMCYILITHKGNEYTETNVARLHNVKWYFRSQLTQVVLSIHNRIIAIQEWLLSLVYFEPYTFVQDTNSTVYSSYIITFVCDFRKITCAFTWKYVSKNRRKTLLMKHHQWKNVVRTTENPMGLNLDTNPPETRFLLHRVVWQFYQRILQVTRKC